MISGSKRIVSNDGGKYTKKVGIFRGSVVKINPDNQWFADNGMELKEGSKATNYVGKSDAGNKTVRLDFWVKEEKTGELFKVNYFLEDVTAYTQDGSKTYYINNQGNSSCVSKEDDLKDWFKRYDYRIALKGEKELYEFLRSWLNDLDLREAGATLQLDMKKLFSGNVSELEQQINGEYAKPVVLAATIKTVEKDGEVKEYQEVYNRAVSPHYNYKFFTDKTYTEEYLDKLREKEANKGSIKGHEVFIKNLAGNYGTKNFYSLRPLHEYDPAENIVGKHENADISDDKDDY